MVAEVLLHWTSPSANPGTTVLNWGSGIVPETIPGVINSFFAAIAPMLSSDTTCSMNPEIRGLDTATGQLISVFAVTPPADLVGALEEGVVANAAQGLIRLHTPGIVNGHRVRGRVFIPGVGVSQQTPGGQLTAPAITTLGNAGNALASANGFGVWARPLKDQDGNILRPGTHHDATSATGWSEFAVQRRRR